MALFEVWGEPGQVLCSNVVRELLLGKGLGEPVPLYEVAE